MPHRDGFVGLLVARCVETMTNICERVAKLHGEPCPRGHVEQRVRTGLRRGERDGRRGLWTVDVEGLFASMLQRQHPPATCVHRGECRERARVTPLALPDTECARPLHCRAEALEWIQERRPTKDTGDADAMARIQSIAVAEALPQGVKPSRAEESCRIARRDREAKHPAGHLGRREVARVQRELRAVPWQRPPPRDTPARERPPRPPVEQLRNLPAAPRRHRVAPPDRDAHRTG